MRSKKVMLMLLIGLLMSTIFVGCGPADTDEEDMGDGEYSFYFLLKTLANPYWVSMKEGIEEAAADAGVEVYVDAMNSEDELGGQLDKLLTAAGQGYDGIGIAPISPTNAIEGVVAANENGIPVVNLDEKIDPDELAAAGGYVIGFATTDNKAVGAKGAQYIIDNTDVGDVAIVEGKAGNASGEDRREGAEQAFLDAGYTIVSSQPADWDRNKALDVATNILSQYPDLKAFYCANDTMALGVQEAVENAGLAGEVLVVGTDGIPEAYESIADGALSATVAQDPAGLGVVCFNMLLDSVKAGEAGSPDEEPAFQYIESILITEDNVGDYLEGSETSETEEEYSFYFLLKTLANPYWVSMKEGIEEAAADAGVEVYVDAMNSEDELGGQLDKLLTAAGQGYDGIGIAPISPTNAIEGVVAANGNGIPVVNLDEKIDSDDLAAAGGYVIGFATTDNKAVGAKGAQYIIDNTDVGEVAIVEGKAGNASGEDRKEGAEQAFLDAGYTIVSSQPADWDRNKALDVATNILSQYPDLKAFYCANDTMALGVQQAVENAGLAGEVLVVGTDGIPEAYESIADGALSATVAQDPAGLGVVCFNMLLDAVKAGNAGSLDEEPAFQYIESILITEDNVGDYLE